MMVGLGTSELGWDKVEEELQDGIINGSFESHFLRMWYIGLEWTGGTRAVVRVR